MAFVGILSPIKLLFGPLVIQLVWYILKQLFTSVSVKVVDIYLAAAARLKKKKIIPLPQGLAAAQCVFAFCCPAVFRGKVKKDGEAA